MPEKQGVALMGRNTTGPHCVLLAGELRCLYVLGWSVTDDDRRWQQMPATITSKAPYTMYRRASNNRCKTDYSKEERNYNYLSGVDSSCLLTFNVSDCSCSANDALILAALFST